MIHNLFPTAIGFYDFEDGITEEEICFIKDLETKPNMGNMTSINNYVLKSGEMSRIAEFVKKCVNEYFDEVYAPKYNVKPYITQSWSNYTRIGQWHHKHKHPNSFISGVFYVSADPKSDKIHFYKNSYQQILVETENWNAWNSESWWFEVETNKLILFPSHLTHMVETVNSDVTRISIAFNTFLEGCLGDNQNLTELLL